MTATPLIDLNNAALTQLLADNVNSLPARDRDFAASLLNGYAKWNSFTEKQRPYVIKMIEKVVAPVAPAKVEVGSLEGIFALFQRVKGRMKAPAIMLQTADGTPVSVAPYKGNQLKVTNGESWNSGLSRWYGAIDSKGMWTPHSRLDATFVAAVLEILTAFAANPAEVAAEYGILTGRCCFCHGKKMTAPESKAVGYGPVCAKNYNMPWGKDKTDRLQQYRAEQVA